MNLFCYCSDDPVDHSDPMGTIIDASSVTERDIGKLEISQSYLSKDPAMKEMVRYVNGPNVHVKLAVINNGKSGFNYKTGTLFWDPSKGMVLSNGKMESAALVLGHELKHIVDYYRNPKAYVNQINHRDRSKDANESMAIESEKHAAKILHEPYRTEYKNRDDAKFVPINDPRQHTEVNESGT